MSSMIDIGIGIGISTIDNDVAVAVAVAVDTDVDDVAAAEIVDVVKRIVGGESGIDTNEDDDSVELKI